MTTGIFVVHRNVEILEKPRHVFDATNISCKIYVRGSIWMNINNSRTLENVFVNKKKMYPYLKY